MEFLKMLINNDLFRVLCIVISLDTVFGILRALKQRKINSCIGIDGIIRKVGMLISIVFLSLIDYTIHINLIGFIPELVRNALNFKDVGLSSLFIILFIVFETLSIFKNMVLCGLPINKKLQTTFQKIMNDFTGEIKEGEEK